MASEAEEKLKHIPVEDRTHVNIELVLWAGKHEGADHSQGKTERGDSFYNIDVCHGGGKKTPAWWFHITLYGSLADQAMKLNLNRCLIRATGPAFQTEWGDKQRQTHLWASTFGYKVKGAPWVDLKPNEPAASERVSSELATSGLAVSGILEEPAKPAEAERPASPPRPSPLPAFNDRSMTELGEAEASPWSKRLARGD
jgi:hypothetical protein